MCSNYRVVRAWFVCAYNLQQRCRRTARANPKDFEWFVTRLYGCLSQVQLPPAIWEVCYTNNHDKHTWKFSAIVLFRASNLLLHNINFPALGFLACAIADSPSPQPLIPPSSKGTLTTDVKWGNVFKLTQDMIFSLWIAKKTRLSPSVQLSNHGLWCDTHALILSMHSLPIMW